MHGSERGPDPQALGAVVNGIGFIPKALGLTQGPARRQGSLVRYAWLVTTWVRPKETRFSRTHLSLTQPEHRGGVPCAHLPLRWAAPEASPSWSFPLSPARGQASHTHTRKPRDFAAQAGDPLSLASRSGGWGCGRALLQP